MDKANNRHIIIRFFLPVLLSSFLLGSALYIVWSHLEKQVKTQSVKEQLTSLNTQLLFLLEAVNEKKGNEIQPLWKLTAHSLDRLEEILTTTEILFQEQEEASVIRLRKNMGRLNGILMRPEIGENGGLVQNLLHSAILDLRELDVLVGEYSRKGEIIGELLFIGGLSILTFQVAFILLMTHQWFLKPLAKLLQLTDALLKGRELPEFRNASKNLYHHISNNLIQHNQQLLQLSRTAEEIGDGNFEQEDKQFEIAGGLGRSIGRMREKIKLSFQDEEKRRWSNEGIAQFSSMVRENNQDTEEWFARVLSALVPFVEASQGGLFLKEEQGAPVLELKASYAWGRRKHLTKSIHLGEGIIGQAALDKDMIMITDVPDDYISIGSGLGMAKPKCILVLPLVSGEELHGVLELASFREFQDYQISFLEKFCEILASAIGVAFGNSNTARLLQETERANLRLKTREEELRQNTEELMATQEAMQRKEIELEVKLEEATTEMKRQIQEIETEKIKNEAILEGCVDGVVSFNEDGKIEYFNKAAEDIWEITREEAMKKHIQDFIPVEILVVENELVVYYAKNGGRKILDARTEVPVKGRAGQEMEVLLTLTRVSVKGSYTFTAFAQKVAVELF